MIAGLVEFDLPPGTSRSDALALYRRSAEGWVANRDLVEKYYLLDEPAGRGGGIYIWPSLEAAQRNLGVDYARMIADRYGSQPTIRLLDAVLRVEPAARRVREL